jgi:hypothetical protein
MADECCRLVGDLDLGIDGCIISFNDSCTTEIAVVCGDEPLPGPTTGTVSITGYADDDIWVGCPSKAGVSIPFARKYDCETDTVHFIFSGQGQSFYTGEANQFVSLTNELSSDCMSIQADSSSGPASIYSVSTQVNGYGMTYNGGPISFTTSSLGTTITFPNSSILTADTYYLNNFSLDLQPGQLPTASYSFSYAIKVQGG